jgi:hypothetical protein
MELIVTVRRPYTIICQPYYYCTSAVLLQYLRYLSSSNSTQFDINQIEKNSGDVGITRFKVISIQLQDTVEILEVKDIPDKTVKVMIKLQKVGELPMAAIFDEYIARGSSVDKPQDQVNALNIILGNN